MCRTSTPRGSVRRRRARSGSLAQPATFRCVKCVCQSSWGAEVLLSNWSAALPRMQARLVIRSWAFGSRHTEASETKCRCSSVKPQPARGARVRACQEPGRGCGDEPRPGCGSRPGWGRSSSASARRSGKARRAVERGAWDPELLQGAANRQVRLLHEPDGLPLLGCELPPPSSPPPYRTAARRPTPRKSSAVAT